MQAIIIIINGFFKNNIFFKIFFLNLQKKKQESNE